LPDEIERIQKAYTERDASKASAIYSYENPAFLFHMQERERAILSALRHSGFTLPGKSVLEVGCGTGHILQRFIEFGAARATGVELMENRVAIANQNYPALDIKQGNAAELPYADNTFDVVTQFMCISSVHDPLIREKIAREMWRVLKPDGIFLSYDLRPIIHVYGSIRAMLGWMRRLVYTPAPTAHVTPIIPLGIKEVHDWKLGGHIKSCKVSLIFRLANTARYSRFLAEMLALAPWLRSATLIILKKPSGH